MTQVVSVKLRHSSRALWFDPEDTQPCEGDHVIVKTDRGTEIGLAVSDICEIDDSEVAELRSPLKPVVRVADEDDLELAEQLSEKADEAMPLFRELVKKHELDMKPVAVEYLFGGEKTVFYFSAEDRVDFRDLVRDLASRVHARIDMRQIGVRDEARIVGGIGHCGQELCCARFGGEFKPVSIRMAKEQDLPLNPLSISGTCGRLMCCLRYEYDAYKDFKQRAPKKGALIETPLGTAKVVEFNTPEEQVKLRLEDGKAAYIPVADMEIDPDKELPPGAHVRPCKVSLEALREHANAQIALALAQYDREHNPIEIEDEEADRPRPRRRSHRGSGSGSKGSRGADQQRDKRDGDASGNGSGEAGGAKQEAGSDGAEKPRSHRRRRHRPRDAANTKDASAPEKQAAKGSQVNKTAGDGEGAPNKRSGSRRRRHSSGRAKQRDGQHTGGADVVKPRPGQHASGVRAQSAKAEHAGSGNSSKRRPRRRHRATSDVAGKDTPSNE